MAEFWAIIKILPELFKLTKELFGWLKKVSGNDPQGFVKKAGKAFKALNEAKTKEERVAAGRAISDLIDKL